MNREREAKRIHGKKDIEDDQNEIFHMSSEMAKKGQERKHRHGLFKLCTHESAQNEEEREISPRRTFGLKEKEKCGRIIPGEGMDEKREEELICYLRKKGAEQNIHTYIHHAQIYIYIYAHTDRETDTYTQRKADHLHVYKRHSNR